MSISGREMVELRILCGGSKTVNRTRTLQKGQLWPLQIPWYRALGEKGVSKRADQYLNIASSRLKTSVSISLIKQSGKGGRLPAWISMDQEAPSKLQMQERNLWDAEKGTDYVGGLQKHCRGVRKKVKTHLELSLPWQRDCTTT